MGALACALGPDGMDIVIEMATGDGLSDLVGGLVRAFAETGAAIADKQDVFDFGQVFYCHMMLLPAWQCRKLRRNANAGHAKDEQRNTTDAFIPKANRVLQKEMFKTGLLACLATGAFPSPRTVACRPIVCEETYSSGYYSGIIPGSRLSSRRSQRRQQRQRR